MPNSLNSLWPNFSKELETFFTDFEWYWHNHAVAADLSAGNLWFHQFQSIELRSGYFLGHWSTVRTLSYSGRLHCLNNMQLVLRGPQAGRIHVFLLFSPNSDHLTAAAEIQSHQTSKVFPIFNSFVLVGILASLPVLSWQGGTGVVSCYCCPFSSRVHMLCVQIWYWCFCRTSVSCLDHIFKPRCIELLPYDWLISYLST